MRKIIHSHGSFSRFVSNRFSFHYSVSHGLPSWGWGGRSLGLFSPTPWCCLDPPLQPTAARSQAVLPQPLRHSLSVHSTGGEEPAF